jgi:hypothetical protein
MDQALSTLLDERAKRINAAHRAIEARHKKNIMDAMAIGDELIEAHAEVPHGQWLDWIKENCVFLVKTAQDYVRMAENRAVIEAANANRSSHLTISEARKLIAKPASKAVVEVIPPGAPRSEELSEDELIAHGRKLLGLPPKDAPPPYPPPHAGEGRGGGSGVGSLFGRLTAALPAFARKTAEARLLSPAEAEAEAFRDFTQWVVEVFRDLGEPPESIRASLDDIAGWLRQCSDPRKWADDLAALEVEYVEEVDAAAVKQA